MRVWLLLAYFAFVCVVGCGSFVVFPGTAVKLFSRAKLSNRLIYQSVAGVNSKVQGVSTRHQMIRCKFIEEDENDGDGEEDDTEDNQERNRFDVGINRTGRFGYGDVEYYDDDNNNVDDDDGDDDDDDGGGWETWDNNGNVMPGAFSRNVDPTVKMSLRDLCRTGCSDDFIGDTMAQLGVDCPIDPDLPIGSYMDGPQIYELLTTINSVNPTEANSGFAERTMYELADDFELSEKKVKFICRKEEIHLPFGMWSCLHETVEEKFLEAVNSGRYDDYHDELYVPNMPDLEAIISTMGETMAAARRGEV